MPAITHISTLPHFLSQEEYRALAASTPASFTDIPPTLRLSQEDVSISLDPPLEGLESADLIHGTLYILTSFLVYMASTGRGFQIEYPAITLHAISRGESGPSIYCQLDESIEEGHSTTEPVDGEEETTDMRELTILVKQPELLEPIFEALSYCAALHPDKSTESDGDDLIEPSIDSDSTVFPMMNEQEELSAVGRAALDYMESIIYNPYEKDSDETEKNVDDVNNKE